MLVKLLAQGLQAPSVAARPAARALHPASLLRPPPLRLAATGRPAQQRLHRRRGARLAVAETGRPVSSRGVGRPCGAARAGSGGPPGPAAPGAEYSVELLRTADVFQEYRKTLQEKGQSIESVQHLAPGIVEGFDFDALLYEAHALHLCLFWMLEGLGLFEEGLVPPAAFWRFLAKVEQAYCDVPYHNFHHACDVTQTLYASIKAVDARMHFSATEKLAMMIAAICHDLNHPGVSNAFLVEARAELALRYNDCSPLENHHAASLYALLAAAPEADVLRALPDAQWRAVRRAVVPMILHTDMAHHAAMVAEAAGMAEAAEDAGGALLGGAEERQAAMSLLLHAADLGGPAKPFEVCSKWSQRVMEEFFEQGELERARGLPGSANTDRAGTSAAQAQLEFMDLAAAPLYAALVRLFPELQPLAARLAANRRRFGALFEAEVDADRSKTPQQREQEKRAVRERRDRFVASSPYFQV